MPGSYLPNPNRATVRINPKTSISLRQLRHIPILSMSPFYGILSLSQIVVMSSRDNNSGYPP